MICSGLFTPIRTCTPPCCSAAPERSISTSASTPLLPAGGKVLVVNNGAYSTRAVEICQFYGLPHIDLSFPIDELPDLDRVEQVLRENPDIALVHTTHNETGTGIPEPHP